MACPLHLPLETGRIRGPARQRRHSSAPPRLRSGVRFVWRRFVHRSRNDGCADQTGCHRQRDGGPKRFLEQLMEAAKGRFEITVLCRGAARGIRPRASDLVLLRQVGRRSLGRAGRLLHEARHRAAPQRARNVDRSRSEGRAHVIRRGSAVRRGGDRHRLLSIRSAGTGSRSRRLLRLSHDRRSRSDSCGLAARRPASSSAAACSGWKPRRPCVDLGLQTARRRVRAAPDGRAGRPPGGGRCCARRSKRWA